MSGADVRLLEQQIYEAAVVPEKWAGVLTTLSGAARSFGTILLTAGHDRQVRSVASPRIEALWREWIAERWTERSQRAPRLLAQDRAGWLRDIDMFSHDEIEALPEYREFLAPRGLKWGAAAAIPMPTGDTVIVSMERLAAEGPFDGQTIAMLDSLYGHLARASMISGILAAERARTAVETLAAIGLPAAAITHDGMVRVTNTLFDRETRLWHTRGGDRISLHDRRADRLFHESLGGVPGPAAGRSIALQGLGTDERAVLHLIPIRGSAQDVFSQTALIAVLTRASARPVPAPPLLRALFDLAPAEAEIASDLAAGISVAEIAVRRRSTVQTVRSHLKSIMHKTGCGRQPELVRMLASLSIPAAPAS